MIRAVIGVRAERDLLDVDAPGPIAVGGAISSPHAHRATRGGLVLIVNHRLVHNRALLAAVDESYRGLIPGGRHGYGVVVVEVSGATVDVNVHPAKREVRFSDERAVFSAVQRACWAALRAAPALGADGHVPAGLAIGTLEIRDGDVDVTGRAASRLLGRPAGEHAAYGPPQQDTMAAPAPGQALPAMEALGQAGSGFVVATAGDMVVLVDPHAAHEKVLYTELLATLASGRAGKRRAPNCCSCRWWWSADPIEPPELQTNMTFSPGAGSRSSSSARGRCDARRCR